MRIWNKFSKKEKYIFYFLTLTNCLPIFLVKFFSTYDGPSHLYNARLIAELLKSNNKVINTFFAFNFDFQSNLLGHFLLAFSSFFMPMYVAEKILMCIYLIGLPISFRLLINYINKENIILSYLIFPLTYSFIFFMGFYNFNLSIVFLLITIGIFYKYKKNLNNKNFLLICFLLILTYLSHLLNFLLAVSIIAAYIFFDLLNEIFKNYKSKKSFNIPTKKVVYLLLLIFMTLLLISQYNFSNNVSRKFTFLSKSELFNWLEIARPIIAFSYEKEISYSKIYFYLLFFLSIISIYRKFEGIKEKLNNFLKCILEDAWLLLVLIITFLYFFMPDSDGLSGYYSIRLCLLLFIFLILWLSNQKISLFLKIFSTIIVFFIHFKLLMYYMEVEQELSKNAQEIYEVSKKIEPNSVILPINRSEHWFLAHFSNYCGIEKPLVILENYEADLPYFPIKWNTKNLPSILLDTIKLNDIICANWNKKGDSIFFKVSNVLIIGHDVNNQDSCNLLINNILNLFFVLEEKSNIFLLFKYKSNIKNK